MDINNFSDIGKKVSEMNIKAYNKGCNDSFDVLIQGLRHAKEKGIFLLTIDKVIEMVVKCKETGNEIPTTYG